MAKTFGFESTADEVLEGVDLSGKQHRDCLNEADDHSAVQRIA
jgi:hypothetical protein